MANLRSLQPQTVVRLRQALGWLLTIELAVAFASLVSGAVQIHKMEDDLHLKRPPSKLGYTVAVSALTSLAAGVFLGFHAIKPDWWQPFSHKGLIILTASTGVFAVFWIAATGSAWFNCTDLCSTFGPNISHFIMYTNQLCCSCTLGQYQQIACGTGRHNFPTPLGGDDNVGGAYHATQAFAILNMLLFFVSTTLWTLLLIQRNTAPTVNPALTGGFTGANGISSPGGFQAPGGYAYPVSPGEYNTNGHDSNSHGGTYEPYKSYGGPSLGPVKTDYLDPGEPRYDQHSRPVTPTSYV